MLFGLLSLTDLPPQGSYIPASRRRIGARRAIAIGLTLVLIAAACSPDEDAGNEQAFCSLLSEGVGLDAANQTLVDFDNLETVAPLELRGTIARLRNTALDLSEIDPLDVEALFNARFDPTALAARTALDDFAEEACGLNLESGPPVRADDATADLDDYLEANFNDAPWVDTVALNVGLSSGRLNSIIARYVSTPTDEDEAAEVCRALSVFLYSIRAGQGTVHVEVDGAVVAFRSGPDASCIAL